MQAETSHRVKFLFLDPFHFSTVFQVLCFTSLSFCALISYVKCCDLRTYDAATFVRNRFK